MLENKIGARGFEPPTPWSRINLTLVILLVRLAWFWLMIRDFEAYSGGFGPKSDPNVNSLVQTKESGITVRSTEVQSCPTSSHAMQIA